MASTLFLDLLKGGAKSDFAAKTFATAFVQHCSENDELPNEIAAAFINDLFRGINFQFLQISARHVQDRLRTFSWPTNEMKRYVFVYEKASFQPIEKFLYKICVKIQILTEESRHSSTEGSPIHWFLQLIAMWEHACRQLRNRKITIYFNEPIGRIDYQLLRGFHILRKSYRDDFPLLDSICGQLLKSVLLGILYPQTHIYMIPGLTKMLHNDFHLFYGRHDITGNFYETILTANVPKSFHKDIYKSLCQLLDAYCLNYEDFNAESAERRQKSLDVSNFMIDSEMLKIYYHYLTNESNASVLVNLLDFLMLLQNKLADVGSFLESFMEAVLFWVLSANNKIGDMSAKFYIAVMKRRADNKFICSHLLRYYFATMNTPDKLLPYIRRLWKYLGTAHDSAFFAGTIADDEEDAKYRIWMAHFLCALVQYMLEDYGKNRSKIIDLLQNIIQPLQLMKCLTTQSVLLDIFEMLHNIDIPDKQTDFKEVFELFANCAEEKLMSFEDWQYPLQKKWFERFKQILEYSEDSNKFQRIANCVTKKCTNVIQELDARALELNFNEIQKYSCALQKLCIITQYKKVNFAMELVNLLHKNLLTEADPSGKSFFHLYADTYKILIDAYAVELYAKCLIQVRGQNNLAWIQERAKELENFLKVWLRNDKLPKMHPIVRIKTYFNCLVGLYFAFGSTKEDNILCLTESTYELLVRTLLHTLFKTTGRKASFNQYAEDTEVHPLRSLLYGQSMVNVFSELHSVCYFEMNCHIIWQICLYYALPSAAAFKTTLHDLLLNLAKNKFNIYKRAIPVVIYNLYKQQPPLEGNSIVKAIKAHKTFIDNLKIEERGRLNCHVVFEVIRILKIALRCNNVPGDRLAALKHLHIFVVNLNLSSEIENELSEELEAVRKSSLSASELNTLTEFLTTFKQSVLKKKSPVAEKQQLPNIEVWGPGHF